MKWIVGGRSAHAHTGGKPFDPALPCTVFVHGALGDHGVWALPARWFAHHGRSVLAVDLPGHALSEGPALASTEAMARWLLALLDAAGVERAAFVGHVALHAASLAPGRATQLVLVATAAPMPVPQALFDLARDDPQAAVARVAKYSLSPGAAERSSRRPASWLHASGLAGAMQRVWRAQGDVGLFATDFGACNADAGALAAAGAVRCPATVVVGEIDKMTRPQAAAALAERLNARVRRLPTGHMPMVEEPGALLQVLREALVTPVEGAPVLRHAARARRRASAG